jgi:DNA/RNA endonuclease YhcR with UshA esterase domain
MKEVIISDRFILWGSITLAVVGLVVLFFLSTILSDDLSMSGLIQGTDDGEKVTVKGVVKRVTQKENVAFVSLSTEQLVDATVFTSDLDLKKGMTVEVTGKIQKYKGKKSIVVDKVKGVE